MIVAKGLAMLEISALVMGEQSYIYPSLIWDRDEVILVDTGFPGLLPKIREAVEQSGVPFNQLSKIIMTHHDIDHIGNLSRILGSAARKVEVLAHEEEKSYIQGELSPVKLTPEKMAQLKALPGEQGQAIKKTFENFKELGAKVDRTVAGGEGLPYCGGINVIHTPGHTPGHICLYHSQSKTLIAGDSLFLENGTLVPAPQFLNHDNEAALNSLEKLTSFDIQTIICYHGGLYQDNTNRRITELVKAGI